MGVLAPVSAQARPSARASMSDIFGGLGGGKLLCWSHTLFQTKIQKDIIIIQDFEEEKDRPRGQDRGGGGGWWFPKCYFCLNPNTFVY